MSQAVPDIYLEMVKWNPALTLLSATYWTFRSSGNAPSIQDRVITWENFDPDDLLHYTRFEYSKSFIRTLSKIPFEESTHYLIRSIRDHWSGSEKRRLLQHLEVIKSENAWMLSCHPAILDPAIHRLVVVAPNYEEYSLVEVICDLSTRRELKGWEPWPYRNRIQTWPQLLGAYNRFFKKTNHVQETLPCPPVEGMEEEGFHIVPLKSRTALRFESTEMTNCIESYVVKIHSREAYAYKLLNPERATVLLQRESGRWSIDEAMTKGNEREVLPGTWLKIRKWLKDTLELKNSKK